MPCGLDSEIRDGTLLTVDRIWQATTSLRADKQLVYLRMEEMVFAALRERWPEPEKQLGLRFAAMTSADYTAYAWLSLFEDKPDDKALAAAQQATLNATSRNYESLLAVACLNAARGNTAEAHQELLDAMSSATLAQPDAGIWYGLGRIFEQYGIIDAASSAYHRTVQMADAADTRSAVPGGGSASTLAHMRLKELTTK